MMVMLPLLSVAFSMPPCGIVNGYCYLYEPMKQAYCEGSTVYELPACVPNDTETLYLTFDLKFLPAGSLSRFKNLESLYLGWPKELPPDLLYGLGDLQSLRIKFSRVPLAIPDGFFSHTPKLTLLDLSYNGIQRINATAFDDLPKLKYISLANNSLSGIEQGTFKYLNQLLWLNLENNPWHCDCKLKEEIRYLREQEVVTSEEAECVSPPRFRGSSLTAVARKMWCYSPGLKIMRR